MFFYTFFLPFFSSSSFYFYSNYSFYARVSLLLGGTYPSGLSYSTGGGSYLEAGFFVTEGDGRRDFRLLRETLLVLDY
jgi:hypothetical protein